VLSFELDDSLAAFELPLSSVSDTEEDIGKDIAIQATPKIEREPEPTMTAEQISELKRECSKR
jgi:hypothetical protein